MLEVTDIRSELSKNSEYLVLVHFLLRMGLGCNGKHA